MKHTVRRSFTTRIFATVLLVALLPLLMMNVALTPLLVDRVEGQRSAQAQTGLGEAVSRLSDQTARLSERLRLIAQSDAVRRALKTCAPDQALYRALFSGLSDVYGEAHFSLYDAQGVRLCAVNDAAAAERLPLEWGVLRSAASAAPDVIYAASGNAAFSMACAVDESGFLVATVDSAQLDALLSDCCGETDNLLLLGAQGRLLYAVQATQAAKISQALREQLLTGAALTGTGGECNFHAARLDSSGFYLILQQPHVFTQSVLTTFSLVTALVGLLCFALCMWGGWVLSRHLARPVREMSEAMAEAQRGNFALRLPDGREDELGRLNDSFNRMMAGYQENLRRSVQHEKELNDTRLRMLQAQLNPHFLYNTLDSMKWMGITHQAPEVATLAADLASLLRAGISGNDFVSLEEELELVERYIDIQSIRFEDRFTCEIAVEEKFQRCMVPKLVLQPIVENAVLHGVNDMEDGFIKIWAEGDAEMITIFVSDNGRGMPPELVEAINRGDAREAGGHLGIYNVNSIIKLHFGAHYGLSAQSAPGEGTRVGVRLPNHQKP